VGYPPVIETGVTDGYEWSLSREIPGKNLGEVWSGLNWDQRDTALRQLWQRTRMVHSVDPAAAEDWALQRPWFNASDADAAGSAIDRLMRHGFFTPGQAAVLNAGLDRFWQALPSARTVLNHGDLTLDNALWNHGQVVALLDFEYAVIAPVELDLNELVKIAFAPAEQPESISDPDRAGSQRLRDTVAEMSIPLLDHPGGSDLLLGYAILLELWLFNDWLAHPEGEGPVETWQPYRRLLSLADGWGGYLESLLS
jgi:scyllo-inosamine 4-kinase